MNVWVLFIYLQVLDVLSTILFLSLGVREANWYFRFFIRHFGICGLVSAKMPVFIFMFAAYKWQKKRVIFIADLYYMAIVLWNIFCANVNKLDQIRL